MQAWVNEALEVLPWAHAGSTTFKSLVHTLQTPLLMYNTKRAHQLKEAKLHDQGPSSSSSSLSAAGALLPGAVGAAALQGTVGVQERLLALRAALLEQGAAQNIYTVGAVVMAWVGVSSSPCAGALCAECDGDGDGGLAP